MSKKKKATGLNISVKKSENFSQWYTEVITKSELIDYYPDVSGCYILRPWCYRIWERIQEFFDREIKALDPPVEPCYFPMFVSEKALATEATHIEDFAPEVAWVTRSGTQELDKPIAIRPTSETIIYPAIAKWIRSHRDLPCRLNQWTNVVRWEFKNPTPFLRTREFLWQEGHSAFATKEEADKEVLEILDLYARVYEEILAVPVIKGRKSEKEKFAGAQYTTTVEGYVPEAGRAIQAGTSHSLGQNFSKMFNINFTQDGSDEKFVWQNSWGLSTRAIGYCVMFHGDDKGLVLPPRVAPYQVVIVPITSTKFTAEVVGGIHELCKSAAAVLSKNGVRCKADLRTDKKPGWKYNYWEQKGVCIRVEVGEKELEQKNLCFVRRDTGKRSTVEGLFENEETLITFLKEELETMHYDMLNGARKKRDERISVVWNFDDFLKALSKGNLVLAPWCLTTASEEWVKEETQRIFSSKQDSTEEGTESNEKGEVKQLTGAAKTLCIPFNQPPLPEGTKCFTGTGELAVQWCLWGRSY